MTKPTSIGRGREEGRTFVREEILRRGRRDGSSSALALFLSLHSGSVSASPIGNIATGPAAANLALYASGSNQRIGACFGKKKRDKRLVSGKSRAQLIVSGMYLSLTLYLVMLQAACFGVGKPCVLDIAHAWAHAGDVSLSVFFPPVYSLLFHLLHLFNSLIAFRARFSPFLAIARTARETRMDSGFRSKIYY